jgi:hypothetical protein
MESYCQTYNSENVAQLGTFYHSDLEFISTQGVQRGPDEILKTYHYLTSIFHNKMTPTDIVINGKIAVVTIKDTFTAKTPIDNFMGMAFNVGDVFTLDLTGTYETKAEKFIKITIDILG